jgi:uncharacterized protein YkwD
MHKKVFIKIIIVMVAAAIFTLPSSVLQVSHAQSDADLQNTILSIHNGERAEVGVPALVWSDELAAGAQTWADQLATTGVAAHSGAPGVGENIAEWTHYPGALTAMVQFWVDEKNGYTLVPFQLGDDDHGHYTAMVWETTTEIGCGMATGSVNDFLVCRYSPPGNANGQLPYGQGAAPAAGDEDAGAPPADQAAGDEDAGAPPADQAAGDEDAGAPPADQAAGDEGDGVGGAQPPVCIFPEVLNPETNQCEVPQPPPADEDAAAPPADEGGDGDGGDINGDGDGDGN